MSFAIVHSRAQVGIDAPRVAVETHLSNGLPAFNIVGLAQTAVKESKDRVRSALINSHFEFPASRITVNLAPADIPKHGGRYDLAIALGILLASNQLPASCVIDSEFYGELALDGALRPVAGLFPALVQGSRDRKSLFIPKQNQSEAGLLTDSEVFAAAHLLELCAHLNGREALSPVQQAKLLTAEKSLDFADVRGQEQAKRVLELAAAGRHNLLFSGPPGTGKTMLASRLPSILPPLSQEQFLEVAALYSLVTPGHSLNLSSSPPFRAPHHSASTAALVGGGSTPRPGEISLAHHGVLFLDELPEFPRNVIEVLREPMESGEIRIARASGQCRFPSQFQLVAARNPCPCGFDGDPKIQCRCTPDQIDRYNRKISGPLLDRIDIQLTVGRLSTRELEATEAGIETSHQILDRVVRARTQQLSRSGCLNAYLNNDALKQHCALEPKEQELLHNAGEQLNLSARAYYKVLKVARTIADLKGDQNIGRAALLEALAYRAPS